MLRWLRPALRVSKRLKQTLNKRPSELQARLSLVNSVLNYSINQTVLSPGNSLTVMGKYPLSSQKTENHLPYVLLWLIFWKPFFSLNTPMYLFPCRDIKTWGTCMYTHTRTHTHMHIHLYTHTHMHTYITYTYAHIYAHLPIHPYTYVCTQYSLLHTHKYTHTQIYKHRHTNTNPHTDLFKIRHLWLPHTPLVSGNVQGCTHKLVFL